ncbi:MAG TPA: VOC family protein [Blastocatellia bacterium]|nr:VOC family protein [Blastocatellia bacterium]
MLAQAKLQTIVWTSDIDQAEHFYTHILGLPLIKRSHGALVYCVNGSDLRVSPVPHTSPSAHTVLGFAVADIRTVIRHLNAQAVELERFPNFPQDENGILHLPGGDQVAWFRDPDGNLLSVVEYAGNEQAQPSS